MLKRRKYMIFYLCDLLLMVLSIAMMVKEETSKSIGLAALESAGNFVLYFILFCISIALLIIVTLIKVIIIAKKRIKKK